MEGDNIERIHPKQIGWLLHWYEQRYEAKQFEIWILQPRQRHWTHPCNPFNRSPLSSCNCVQADLNENVGWNHVWKLVCNALLIGHVVMMHIALEYDLLASAVGLDSLGAGTWAHLIHMTPNLPLLNECLYILSLFLTKNQLGHKIYPGICGQ